jgi:hypothetical protein
VEAAVGEITTDLTVVEAVLLFSVTVPMQFVLEVAEGEKEVAITLVL